MSEGTYKAQFSGAGFEPVWYPNATTFAEAEDIEVSPTSGFELESVTLVGRPGTITGVVVTDEPVGATVRLVVRGHHRPERRPAWWTRCRYPPTGRSLFEEVPSPGSYQLIVEKPGFATEVRDVELGAAQELDDIEVILQEGGGLISGSVQSPSGPLGGATVTATDGTTTFSTVSLTVGEVGFFAIRGLPTPGRYTVTFESGGFITQTRSIDLGDVQARPDLSITLLPSTGSIAGTVSQLNAGPVGGVTVTISGRDVELTTLTASQGTPGSYLFTALPAPAAYTVTFSKDGLVEPVADGEPRPGDWPPRRHRHRRHVCRRRRRSSAA